MWPAGPRGWPPVISEPQAPLLGPCDDLPVFRWNCFRSRGPREQLAGIWKREEIGYGTGAPEGRREKEAKKKRTNCFRIGMSFARGQLGQGITHSQRGGIYPDGGGKRS